MIGTRINRVLRSADDYGFFTSLKLIFEVMLVIEKFYTELHGVFLNGLC